MKVDHYMISKVVMNSVGHLSTDEDNEESWV